MWKFARLLLPVLCFILLATTMATRASAVEVSPASHSTGNGKNATLQVAIAAVAPFVLPQTTTPEGFSIDIWDEIARRMHADFAWRRVATQADLLPAVQRGDADVAIAAITMTPQGESQVDFSIPYFDAGLQIMVRSRSENGFFVTVPWLAIGQLLVVAAVIVFALANLVWLLERKHAPNFQKPWLHAVGEGLWVTMLIIATGEHGERETAGMWKRILVPAMWLIGVVLIAQLTATVTSSQTVARLQSSIRGPEDLPGKKIATVPGTVAAAYLTERGLPYVNVNNAADGFRMIMQGTVDAIVYDAPTLQYWATRLGTGQLAVVGPIFRPEKYGIAVANGSPLRKTINATLLAIYEDGTYERIYGKWFSQGK